MMKKPRFFKSGSRAHPTPQNPPQPLKPFKKIVEEFLDELNYFLEENSLDIPVEADLEFAGQLLHDNLENL